MTEIKETDPRPLGVDGAKALEPEQFGMFLGMASWLMSMSKDHRDLPITTLEGRVLPAILLKQFKLYQKGKMPIAFLTWATVSDEIKFRMEQDVSYTPKMTEWRCGKNLVIVDCVSPFAVADEVKQQFINSMTKPA